MSLWRNLAEVDCRADRSLADTRGRAASRVMYLCSGLLADKRAGTRVAFRAEADQGCQCEQCQAAGHRVKRDRNPGRGRKSNCTGRDGYPNRCRNQDQSRKHLLQLQREPQGQVARIAWQECGCVWEILSSEIRAERKFDTTARRRLGGNNPKFSLDGFLHPEVENPSRPSNARDKILKRLHFVAGVGSAKRRSVADVDWADRCGRRSAAIWHKPEGPDSPCNPALTDDCLSFVIPEQQGAGVVALEDGK